MEEIFNLKEQKEAELTGLTSASQRAATVKPASVLLSERLRLAYQADAQTWLNEVATDRNFVKGAQWKQRDVNILLARNQMPIVVNVIKQAVETAKAMLTANDPRFSATGKEDSDVKLAQGISYVLADIWEKSLGNTKLKRIVKSYYTDSVGWFLVWFDPNGDFGRGQVCVDYVDTLEVLVDPSSTDPFARDAAHILINKTMNAEQIQQTWPQYADKLPLMEAVVQDQNKTVGSHIGLENQADSQKPKDSSHRHYQIIDRYTRINRQRHHFVHAETFFEKLIGEDEVQAFLASEAFLKKSLNQYGEERIDYLTREDQIRDAVQMMTEIGPVWHYAITPGDEEPALVRGPIQELSPDEQQRIAQGEPLPQPIPNSQVEIAPVTYGELVEKKVVVQDQINQDRILKVFSIGGVECYNDIIECSNYSLVPCYANFEGNPFNYSPVRGVRGIQEYINKMYSLVVAHAASSTNVKLLIPRGSQNIKDIEERWGKAGTAVIEYDPELGVPIVAGPVPLPNELYANIERAKTELNEQLGIYPLMQGSSDKAPDTYKGTLALDEYGQRRIRAMKDDIEESLAQVGRVCLEMVQAYYKEFKIIRLLQPNNKVVSVAVNTGRNMQQEDLSGVDYQITNVASIQYDVSVVGGSTLPSNRWALAEYYMMLYEKQIIDQVEVLKKTEVADAEGVLERFSYISKLQQQLQQATEMIKNLKGDLQTAEREVANTRMQMEVNNFSLELEKKKIQAQSAVELFGARMNDEMANQRKQSSARPNKKNGRS